MSERMYRVCFKTKSLRTVAVAWTNARSMKQAMQRNLEAAQKINKETADSEMIVSFLECETKRQAYAAHGCNKIKSNGHSEVEHVK